MLSEYGENLETFYIICKESKNYLNMMDARAKYSYGPIIVNCSHNDEKLLMRQKTGCILKKIYKPDISHFTTFHNGKDI